MPKKYQSMFLALFFASVISIFLLYARMLRTNTYSYVFMVWNLFLAWVPCIISLIIEKDYHRFHKITFIQILLLIAWFFFYPNAPYIVTDLIHLRVESVIPVWFDALFIFFFAWTGVFLGFTSLFMLHQIVLAKFGRVKAWVFVAAVNFLSSFGIIST